MALQKLTRLILLWVLVCVWALPDSTHARAGLWVLRYSVADSTQIEPILGMARKLQIGDLYLQVRALGQTYYPPASAGPGPQAEKTSAHLARLIRMAHKHNIRVHAWINTLYIWSGQQAPKNPAHLYFEARNHLLRAVNQSGIPSYGELKKQGIEGYFIDPDCPENRTQIRRVIEDMITIFNIDGIHFDYFRFPSKDYSFSSSMRSKFKILYQIDPVNVFRNPNKFILERGYAAYEYIDKSYNQLLQESLTGLLTDLNRYAKSLNSEVKVSLAVKASALTARNRFFQDWPNWIRKDLCDFLVLMNYYPDEQEFKKNLEYAQSLSEHKRIVIGISTYNQSMQEIRQKIQLVKKSNLGGYSLFSFDYLQKNGRIHAYLQKAKNDTNVP